MWDGVCLTWFCVWNPVLSKHWSWIETAPPVPAQGGELTKGRSSVWLACSLAASRSWSLPRGVGVFLPFSSFGSDPDRELFPRLLLLSAIFQKALLISENQREINIENASMNRHRLPRTGLRMTCFSGAAGLEVHDPFIQQRGQMPQ